MPRVNTYSFAELGALSAVVVGGGSSCSKMQFLGLRLPISARVLSVLLMLYLPVPLLIEKHVGSVALMFPVLDLLIDEKHKKLSR